VPHVPYDTLTALPSKVDETGPARSKILSARVLQTARQNQVSNSSLSARELEKLIHLSPEVKELLKLSSQKLNLSPRSYHRLIKVSRTIADLDNAPDITSAHVLEALQYRVSV
jgi:magnesium chelatase family protein